MQVVGDPEPVSCRICPRDPGQVASPRQVHINTNKTVNQMPGDRFKITESLNMHIFGRWGETGENPCGNGENMQTLLRKATGEKQSCKLLAVIIHCVASGLFNGTLAEKQ